MDILVDLYQQGQINQARNRAAQAQSVAEQLRWELDTLKRKSDALTLACQALWEIVRSQGGLKDTAILEKMRASDIRDGKLDSRIHTARSRLPSLRAQKQRQPQRLHLLRRKAACRKRLRKVLRIVSDAGVAFPPAPGSATCRALFSERSRLRT